MLAISSRKIKTLARHDVDTAMISSKFSIFLNFPESPESAQLTQTEQAKN